MFRMIQTTVSHKQSDSTIFINRINMKLIALSFLIVSLPICLFSQSSLGFTTKNYALEPAVSPQVLHIPVSAIDVSYGLTYQRQSLYKDLDVSLYTGLYLAQQGFGEYLGFLYLEDSGKSGRRQFLDFGLTISKPIYEKKQFSFNAYIEPQLLLALENTSVDEVTGFGGFTIFGIYNVQLQRVTGFTVKRNPTNLFMNYGLSVDYRLKRLPFVFNAGVSFRDIIGSYFTKIDITTLSRFIGDNIDNGNVDITQIKATGNAIGYNLSVRYQF